MHRTYTKLSGLQRTYDVDIQSSNQRCIVRFEGDYKGEVLSPPVGVRLSNDELYTLACMNIEDSVGLDE